MVTSKDIDDLHRILSNTDEDNLIPWFNAHKLRCFVHESYFYIEIPHPTPPTIFELVEKLYVPFRHLFAPGEKFSPKTTDRPGVKVFKIKLRS